MKSHKSIIIGLVYLVPLILLFSHPVWLYLARSEESLETRRVKENSGITIRLTPIIINNFTSVVYAGAVNAAGKNMGESSLIFKAYPNVPGIVRMILKVEPPFYGQGVGDMLFAGVMGEVRKQGVRYVIIDFTCPYCSNPKYMVNFLRRQEEGGEIKDIIYVPSDIFIPNTTPPQRYAVFEVIYPDYILEEPAICDGTELTEAASSEDIVLHLRNGQPIGTLNKKIPENLIRIIGELPNDKLTNSAGFIAASRKPMDMLEFAEFMADLNYIGTTSPDRETGDIAIYRDAKGRVSFIGLFIDGEWVRGLWLNKLVVECREEFLPSDWTAGKVTYYRRIK